MENQKDIEILKYSLAVKLELFNKIRFGYSDIKEEVKGIVTIEEHTTINKQYDVVNSYDELIDEEELVLVDTVEFTDTNEPIRKPTITLNNLGTSYFGRKRR